MNDDGTMARMPDLIPLRPVPQSEDRHDRRPDRLSPKVGQLVERSHETSLVSEYGGEFQMVVFTSQVSYAGSIALVKRRHFRR